MVVMIASIQQTDHVADQLLVTPLDCSQVSMGNFHSPVACYSLHKSASRMQQLIIWEQPIQSWSTLPQDVYIHIYMYIHIDNSLSSRCSVIYVHSFSVCACVLEYSSSSASEVNSPPSQIPDLMAGHIMQKIQCHSIIFNVIIKWTQLHYTCIECSH